MPGENKTNQMILPLSPPAAKSWTAIPGNYREVEDLSESLQLRSGEVSRYRFGGVMLKLDFFLTAPALADVATNCAMVIEPYYIWAGLASFQV